MGLERRMLLPLVQQEYRVRMRLLQHFLRKNEIQGASRCLDFGY